MRKLLLPLVLTLLVLCGCANHYVVKLTNGTRITTASKPKLKGSDYHFKDAKGGDNVISRGRVAEIEPASMVAEDTQFKVSQSKPRHWWQFWR